MRIAFLAEPGRELTETRLKVRPARDAPNLRPFMAKVPNDRLAIRFLLHPFNYATTPAEQGGAPGFGRLATRIGDTPHDTN